MNETSTPTGSLKEAMQRASQLLADNPQLAAEQLTEIIKSVPDYAPASLLLASAKRRLGEAAFAVKLLEPLIQTQDKWVAAHFELGLSLGKVGRGDEAIAALKTTLELQPKHPEAWRYLADHLLASGDPKASDEAYQKHILCSTQDPVLQQAAAAMVKNEIPIAERILKSHLKTKPTDVPAIRMLAEVAIRCGQDEEAELLLKRCLDLAPSFAAARYNYAVLLHRHNDSASALIEIEKLIDADEDNPKYRNLIAVILSRVGEYARSSEIYLKLLTEYPTNAKVWLSYGHVLKTEGRQEVCIDAYQKSIERDPAFGEAYWSLANLKTFRFSAADFETMREQVAKSDLSDENRIHFHFALGKASEDSEAYLESFDSYEKGNTLYRQSNPYDADLNSTRVKRLKAVFTPALFAARKGVGCQAKDPIFIVGMPRSGSTLLEQILSSHSLVEGTTELPEIVTIAKKLREESGSDEIVAYAEVLAAKSDSELRQLGELYMDRTRIHRKTNRPFFIDKMPNNFLHIGMIRLVLPNAKIIDARRHPLACCFSNFKQYYARGQNFSYGLEDMGRFYYDYTELMAHYDEVLPKHIHRVIYEHTVEDTKAVVDSLLAYCGLSFEEGCLRFFENQRPVRTASSEQVRQPIYTAGVDQWKHYEAYLDPVKQVLGSVLDKYPAVPPFRPVL